VVTNPGDEVSAETVKANAEAQKRIKLESLIEKRPQYYTLFKGLKVGHSENVAIVHPLVFLLRRLFMAFAVILMGQYGVVVAAILQALTTFCVCYLIVYK